MDLARKIQKMIPPSLSLSLSQKKKKKKGILKPLQCCNFMHKIRNIHDKPKKPHFGPLLPFCLINAKIRILSNEFYPFSSVYAFAKSCKKSQKLINQFAA